MKKFLGMTIKIILIVLLGSGLLLSCDNDDKKQTITGPISNTDPSYGFLVNSTPYRLTIDIDENEEFKVSLNPGMILGIRLQAKSTHGLHVIVLNEAGRAIEHYVNNFYIDEIPLDNRLKDFICSWFVEFTSENPEYGFANKFGT